MLKLATNSEKETRAFAADLAKHLRGGAVLALRGNLGSGKTTFVKGLAQGLGVQSRVVSPTFILAARYNRRGARQNRFFHLDLYRLRRRQELEDLGINEILTDFRNITAIEWPELARGFLPDSTICLTFRLGRKPNQRLIQISKMLR